MNKCGEEKCAEVFSMSVVRRDWSGWFDGGRSQRDDPGIAEGCG